MLIKVKKQILVDAAIEVEFPLFVHSLDVYDGGGGGYDTYYRIDADGCYWRLHRRHGRADEDVEYEFDAGEISIELELERYTKYFKSDAKEFAKVLQEFKTKLGAFPGVQA